MERKPRCPICNNTDLMRIFSKESSPKYNLERHFDRDSALGVQKGRIEFYLCQKCLFVFNAAFDEMGMDYAVDYENSRSNSKYFQEYLIQTCKTLDEVFSVRNKTVVEIGCGDGQFLNELRRRYNFDGYGYDPSLNTNMINRSIGNKYAQDLHFVQGYYRSGSLDTVPEIIILRHVVEHQKNPNSFFESILSMPEDGRATNIYIEVPAWEWIVDNNWILAFCYEHCSYYSRFSLEEIMHEYHYTAKKISFGFANEYLQYYGVNQGDLNKPCLREKNDSVRQSIIEKSLRFGGRMQVILDSLKMQLNDLWGEAVLWGASGKGTTLLNILDINHDKLAYVVDSNPRRHNTYVPGTGQLVVAPEFLKTLKPKYILMTNSSYENEIGEQLASFGLHPDFVFMDRMIKDI